MRICDLRQKEVINIKDCKMECDIPYHVRITHIFFQCPEQSTVLCSLSFGQIQCHTHSQVFCRVCQIGPDIILVDIDEGEKPIRDKEK